jgi:hypothetical protein
LSGQLGIGGTAQQTQLTLITSIQNVNQISAGRNNGYALVKSTNQVFSWVISFHLFFFKGNEEFI